MHGEKPYVIKLFHKKRETKNLEVLNFGTINLIYYLIYEHMVQNNVKVTVRVSHILEVGENRQMVRKGREKDPHEAINMEH